MNFITSVGLEYTFLAPRTISRKLTSKDEDIQNIGRREFNALIKAFQIELKSLVRSKKVSVSDDNDAIEITTPIHKTEKDLLKYYSIVCRLAKKYKLRFYSPIECNGGCHIHLSLPKMKFSDLGIFLRNLYIDSTTRPYLNWIFNEPEDNISANSFAAAPNEEGTDRIHEEGINWIAELNKKEFFNPGDVSKLTFEKRYTVRYSQEYNTIEFRFFDMPRNRFELNLNVTFALSYFRYILKKSKERKRVSLGFTNFFMSGNLLQKGERFLNEKRNKEVVLQEFYSLLRDIGLEKQTKKYDVYLKRNLNTRLSYGKEYLI